MRAQNSTKLVIGTATFTVIKQIVQTSTQRSQAWKNK